MTILIKLYIAEVANSLKKNSFIKLTLLVFCYNQHNVPSIDMTTDEVFEKIVFDQLYQYFTDNDLIFTSQYGFRKLHSTELASIELIDRTA